MTLVKCILGKINHVVVNLVGNLCRDAIGHTTRNLSNFACDVIFNLSTVNENLTILFDDILLFLTHCTTNFISATKRISSKLLNYLHNLLLVNDTSVGWSKNRLKLRTVVGNLLTRVLTLNVIWNEIHRAWTVKGNTGDNILDRMRLKLFHEVLHAGRFQLKNALAFTCRNHIHNSLVIVINLIHVKLLAVVFLHKLNSIIYNSKSSKAKKVHLQKAKLFDCSHDKLGNNGTITTARKWNILIHWLAGNNNTGSMHTSISRQTLKCSGNIDEISHLIISLVESLQLRIHGKSLVQGNT